MDFIQIFIPYKYAVGDPPHPVYKTFCKIHAHYTQKVIISSYSSILAPKQVFQLYSQSQSPSPEKVLFNPVTAHIVPEHTSLTALY